MRVHRLFKNALGLRKCRAFARDESGALIIFTLYILMAMIMIGGLAVDIMMAEERRARIQFTIDGATLSAADLQQTLEACDIMEGQFRSAGFANVHVNHTRNGAQYESCGVAEPDADIAVDVASVEGIGYRRVEAEASIRVPTLFMHWVGVDYMDLPVSGAAEERITDIEISLVVDVSGSMGNPSTSGESKIFELRKAAKEFFTAVVKNDPDDDSAITSVSIVPYYHTVHVGEDLLDQLNANGGTVSVQNPIINPPGLTSVQSEQQFSSCIEFTPNDFKSTAITPSQKLTRKAHFAYGSSSTRFPNYLQFECQEDRFDTRYAANSRPHIMVHRTEKSQLDAHIDTLTASGNTAIDVGMKWGVALLDPAIQPAVKTLADDTTIPVPSRVNDRPANYWVPSVSANPQDETLKVIVLMTDGVNTTQYGQTTENQYPYINFKNSPAPVWRFKNWSTHEGKRHDRWSVNRNMEWYDQYLIYVPGNSWSNRWYRPGDPNTSWDDQWYSTSEIPWDGIAQMDWVNLLDDFHVDYMAEFFWDEAEQYYHSYYGWSTREDPMEDKLKASMITQTNWWQANTNLSEICAAARAKGILIYAIGFEVNTGEGPMRDCATEGDAYYFDVSGREISTAFAAIANHINQLRLVQ